MTLWSEKYLRLVGHCCFALGFVSIIGSICVWFVNQGDASPDALAHAERFGIFVGLWAPTFFVLSNRFSRYADRAD